MFYFILVYNIYIYIYVCVYICVCVCVSLYIYIYRQLQSIKYIMIILNNVSYKTTNNKLNFCSLLKDNLFFLLCEMIFFYTKYKNKPLKTIS